jgi:ABC-2 type transport system ATP-binding protein
LLFSREGKVLALRIANLSKTYSNGVQALKGVTLTIGNNMFGLLGPTLQSPDTGEIWLDDLDVLKQKDDVRRILGYLPQEFGVYPKMSALDMLDHLAVMKGILQRGERKEMVDSLLHQTNLWDFRKKALGTFCET